MASKSFVYAGDNLATLNFNSIALQSKWRMSRVSVGAMACKKTELARSSLDTIGISGKPHLTMMSIPFCCASSIPALVRKSRTLCSFDLTSVDCFVLFHSFCALGQILLQQGRSRMLQWDWPTGESGVDDAWRKERSGRWTLKMSLRAVHSLVVRSGNEMELLGRCIARYSKCKVGDLILLNG